MRLCDHTETVETRLLSEFCKVVKPAPLRSRLVNEQIPTSRDRLVSVVLVVLAEPLALDIGPELFQYT